MNKPVHISSTMTVGQNLRKQLGLARVRFQPRQRQPNEALPNVINKMSGFYTPPDMTPVRAGASDHLSIKSRGNRT